MARFRIGNNIVSATITKCDKELLLNYDFNVTIKDELKIMLDTPRWNPEKKAWACKDSLRSKFILDWIQGFNPYKAYDAPLKDFKALRPIARDHQNLMIAFGLSRLRCIIAAEMGTGKTFAAIEIMEQSGKADWWFVAPKGALASVRLEVRKWMSKVHPRFMTYEEHLKVVTNWKEGDKLPDGIIYDEASRLKNPKAKRTQAAQHIANHMPEGSYVILMSGSPAPKSPTDWWSLCEIARPGYLKEGSQNKFTDRIAIVKQEENVVTGTKYPKIITFKDDVNKCNVCGALKDSQLHAKDEFDLQVQKDAHYFVPSKNEVAYLAERMKGLVLVIMKKDCLQLPEKVYQTIDCEPAGYTKQLAKMIVKTAISGAQALIRLRELSDGFQYHEKLVGTVPCKHCAPANDGCIHCSNKGVTKVFETETVEIETPKIQALIDLLELKEEDGRIVIYAGFTGSIDRIIRTVLQADWQFIRVDGTGWTNSLGLKDAADVLQTFQSDDPRKIAFVGHPQSAGMGLTLTKSDTIVYYSNDFNAESRIQSEDRIHRMGSRGANIIDLIHLPTDLVVLNNLKKKRDLQSMSLGELDTDEVRSDNSTDSQAAA